MFSSLTTGLLQASMKLCGGLELDTASLNPESCTPKDRALRGPDRCMAAGTEASATISDRRTAAPMYQQAFTLHQTIEGILGVYVDAMDQRCCPHEEQDDELA